MNKELKDAIIAKIQSSVGDFQLLNSSTEYFKSYIYDTKGEYIIGGQEVRDFMVNFINLYK